MIKHIIFDAMGVVFTVSDDTNDLLVPFILEKKENTGIEDILKLYHEASLGNITPLDFWRRLGFCMEVIPAVQKEYLETRLTLDTEFKECVKKIKEKYDIAMLSNDIAEWSWYLRKFHQIEVFFKYVFISSDMRVRKPDKKIYTDALSRMNAKPQECIFIDDDPKRVESAAELGIIPILFNRNHVPYSGIQVLSFQQLSQML